MRSALGQRYPRRLLLAAVAGGALALTGCKVHEPAELATEGRGPIETAMWERGPGWPLAAEQPLPRIPESARAPEDGQWLMSNKDYASTRYSELAQITTGNVAGLGLVWEFDTGLARGQEAAPLVVGSTMYVVMPFPNLLYAFDLGGPEPSVRWVYDPEPAPASQGVACCDHVNRGAAYADGRVFFNTLDAQTVAVDAETGEELWKTPLGNIQIGETMTMAPLVVRDRVLVGNSGGEFGVRGWIKALDTATGEVVWTGYSTGPDAEVLIGERFRPFYERDQGADLGVRTWPPGMWKQGGGNVWGWVSYDPELDLIYYGTANPGVWNPEIRPGDNKWGTALFARDPDTGEAVWAYQWAPHAVFDWDGVNESVLLDMPVRGQMRRVLVRAERNGFFYVIDRATGEVLSAEKFVHANVVREIDLETGQPDEDQSKKPGFGRTVGDICPAVPGAKDWQPMAFSARTGLIYIPGVNLCNDIEGTEANYIAGTPYMGASVKMYAGPGGHRGELIAWDPVRQVKVWGIRERFPIWSGVLATAGDVVFYGTMDRWFKAVDARTGETLWQFQTKTGIIAPPITYVGPDGRQYVAVLSGPGGWAGSVVSVPLDPRDDTSDKGFVNAMKDLPAHTPRGGFLYIFALR